ncbi:hypothetical protein QFC21_001862 [Naganishia friedmannii]|uniref:Uncharacterized protein n=1 Tax=Naganishia friedmannii TaxID=89922 RepID=A0ACC2W3Q4_9TREE|nr:hypothetical protein QFC21_001862 [Naganishia friedmannii]
MRGLVSQLLQFPRFRRRSLCTPQTTILLPLLYTPTTASLVRSSWAPDCHSIRSYTSNTVPQHDSDPNDPHQGQRGVIKAKAEIFSVPPDDESNTKNTPPALPTSASTTTSSIKKINKALSRRQVPELVEEELEEQFVRATNKTSNALSFPGFAGNESEAPTVLTPAFFPIFIPLPQPSQLDQQLHPGENKADLRIVKAQMRKANKKKKAKKKYNADQGISDRSAGSGAVNTGGAQTSPVAS